MQSDVQFPATRRESLVSRHELNESSVLRTDPHQPSAESPEHANFINESLGNPGCTGHAWCAKSGFQFRIAAVCKLRACKEYVVVATPVNSNTGMRSFCSASD